MASAQSVIGDDVKALFGAIDAEATRLGDLIGNLTGQIKNSMTDQEVADIKAAGDAVKVRLGLLGANPTDPVPPPTPEFTSATRKFKK